MKKTLVVIAIIIYSLYPKQTFAWGRTGHSLVAEIAFKNLDEKTKKNVLKYLDGLNIEDAANWMDGQRSDPSFDYLKPLHYINIEKGKEYNNEPNNIASELKRILSDFDKINTLTDDAIKMDLLELFHLIGDLHQPLHCGYGGDKGGNTYQVQFNGKGSNLHKVWDTEIIEYKNITLNDVSNSADIELKQNKKFDELVVLWLNESKSLVDGLYPSNHKISEDYINTSTPVIKRQLLLAGMRLSAVLSHYFKSFNKEPKFQKSEDTNISEVDINDLDKHLNKMVKVCTKVYSTKQLASGITFLNLGGEYPNSPLTIVIFKDKLSNFKNSPEKYYYGKNICVTGKLILYKGKPEIIVSNEMEIVVK